MGWEGYHTHRFEILGSEYGVPDVHFPEMKIIDVFICKLRKKLSNAGITNCIETVWGRGYLMPALEADELQTEMETPGSTIDEAYSAAGANN